MQREALFISICVGLAILLFIVFFATLQYTKSLNKTRREKENPNEWLFHDFYLKVYSAFFGMKDEDEVAVELGINVEKYYNNCAVAKVKPNTKKLIVYNLYGYGCLFLSLVLFLLVSPLSLVLGALLFLFLVFYEPQKLSKKAESMRLQASVDLPRFLDLLQTELLIGLPIENAIYIICEKFPCLLSREFLEALNEMELGISGWQQALEKVATKYGVETLSDFVLEVSTAYSKGVSITDSVIRKTKEVKKTHLLNVKERTGKAENTMLIPLAALQIFPTLAFMIIPTISQITSAF